MNMLKFLIIALLLILPVGLAACGGGGAERQQPANSAAAAQEEPAEASEAPAGDVAEGKVEFEKTCSACHGPEGKGIEGLGKDMTGSEFIAGKTNEELVEFIKQGRNTSDPLNTTGVDMPPKGGNPALDDEDLYDIVAFIRSIHE